MAGAGDCSRLLSKVELFLFLRAIFSSAIALITESPRIWTIDLEESCLNFVHYLDHRSLGLVLVRQEAPDLPEVPGLDSASFDLNPCRPWVEDDLDVGFAASAGWACPWHPWEVPGVPAISHWAGADFALEQAFAGPPWRPSFGVPCSCQRDPGASCWEGIGLPAVVEAAFRHPVDREARVAEIQTDWAVAAGLAAVEAAVARFYSEAAVEAASFVAVEAVASAFVEAVAVPEDRVLL